MQHDNSQSESNHRRTAADGGRPSSSDETDSDRPSSPAVETDGGRTSPPSVETDGGRTSPPSVETDGGRTSPPSVETDDDRPSSPSVETDGGVAEREAEVDYLDTEINILSPNTPFMRDHLKLVWTGFLVWTVLTWGPVVATFLAPELMTQEIPVIQFPAHYFTVAFVAPTSSLVLAFVYSRRRDKLDEKYGIDHGESVDAGSGGGGSGPETDEESVAADGGDV